MFNREDMIVNRKQVLSYLFLPGVLPRARTLAGSGFANLAYFMALVYRAAGILPDGHVYLRPSAIGTFGMRQVLAEAADHLVVSRRNIDQIILFVALLAGLVILALQFALLLLSILINPAAAQDSEGVQMPSNYADFFVTAEPAEDIAFRLMDRVFGIPDMFGSKDMAEGESAFHSALHSLFQFYSIGLLVIAVIIALYFVAAILAETAQTGTPFGKRYNHVWAPIRLVAALGLLIPIGSGLNAAQWITLYAAKFGSGFATNGWIVFNEAMTESYLGQPDALIAKMEKPEAQQIAAFMTVVLTCEYAERVKNNRTIDAWLVKGTSGGNANKLMETSFEDALKFFDNGDIYVRFGEIGKKGQQSSSSNGGTQETIDVQYMDQKGYVYPYCGDVILQVTDLYEPGSLYMQTKYYQLLQELWANNIENMKEHAEYFSRVYLGLARDPRDQMTLPQEPTAEFKEKIKKYIDDYLTKAIDEAVKREVASIEEDKEHMKYGWGGAAIWYNRVAQINGALVAAIRNVPRPQLYPSTMEYRRWKKFQQDHNLSAKDMFDGTLKSGKQVRDKLVGDTGIGDALNAAYEFWDKESFDTSPLGTHTSMTGNAFIDAINVVLGTHGLFDMCRNTDVHPLAQLSAVGKGLMESAIRNLGFSVGAGVSGLAAGMIPHLGAALSAASSFFVTVASATILIGFILFYVIPFLPFLYFFFAVGGWVKGIFEAMVGVPLWALAHLRIDGDGLPGDAAMNGYFLIFEIFLRPILIVFGLLAAVSIFGAMVKVLNEIFYLVVSNLSGFNPENLSVCGQEGEGNVAVGSLEYFRGPVDEFFFTIIYAILVYMIGMSCFKLIDMIPNNILRWMGAGVATFNDQAGEPAEGLITRMAVGGGAVASQLKQAGSQISSAVGHLPGAAQEVDQALGGKTENKES